MQIIVDQPRLSRELDQLAQFSDAVPPAVTRVLLTPPDLAARQFLKELAAEAGLAGREDAVGNLFFRWAGTDESLPAIATGSHLDAIPDSGKYDGTVGVLGGLEAIRALQRAGIRPRRSLELIMFTAEEPTRFGVGCLGSRLLSGQFSASDAAQLLDRDQTSLETARRTAGCQGELSETPLPANHYAAFVELHIEQGPLLEAAGVPIGVVSAIAAPATLHVEYQGPGGHAGAVLMADRADPLLAGARLALDVEQAALQSGSQDAVATVGVLDVSPGAVNSVPRDVRLEIDLRDINKDRRDRVLQQIIERAEQRGTARGVTTAVEVINADPPAVCSTRVVEAVEKASRTAEAAARPLISRAYHDSLFMASICPTGMIFIPCRGGVSHRPDEYAAPEAIATGVEVLARTLFLLTERD